MWCIACLLAAAGLFYCGVAASLVGVMVALTLVNIGVSASKPPLWSMPVKFLAGSGAAAGIAAINALGNLGGFVGPAMIGLFKGWTGSFMRRALFRGGAVAAVGAFDAAFGAIPAQQAPCGGRRPELSQQPQPSRISPCANSPLPPFPPTASARK